MRARRPWTSLWLAVVLAGAAAHAWSQPAASEASVKAAYLFKFLSYVEWPQEARPAGNAPLVIGVAGSEAVLEELKAVVDGRLLNDRTVIARRVSETDTMGDLHALFVGRELDPARFIARMGDRPVLVVAEAPGSLRAGAMLNFVPVGGRIRFEAAPATAERARLKLSARLLAVAERVLAP